MAVGWMWAQVDTVEWSRGATVNLTIQTTFVDIEYEEATGWRSCDQLVVERYKSACSRTACCRVVERKADIPPDPQSRSFTPLLIDQDVFHRLATSVTRTPPAPRASIAPDIRPRFGELLVGLDVPLLGELR